jgi:superfamily I DNA/RNA helicase
MASLDWLRFHQAMLIGEVVPETLRYLQAGRGLGSRWRWRHCLVDEYQDLNKAEQVLVDTLAEGATITVIGDPNQSIYRQLKHAHPEGILEFETNHPGTETHFLTECRRCPRRIVDLANNLISRNPRLVTSSLCAHPGVAAGRVHVVEWDRPEDEATGLARFIKWYLCTHGVGPGDVLVLCPRRQIGYAVRDELKALDVPVHSYFHEEALESEQAKERFAALSLAANIEDRVALRSWLGLGNEAVTPAGYRRLRDHCESCGEIPLQAIRRMASGNLTLRYLQQMPQRAQEVLEELAWLGSLDGKDLVDAWVAEGEEETAELRRLSLNVVGGGNPTAEQLLGELREVIIRPEPRPEQDDSVAIMSLHKSKGLTANLVVVAGCVDGLIPTIDRRLTISEQDSALEEQRRLFYVAFTRSTDWVVMSYPLYFPRAVAHRIGVQFRPRGALAETARSPFIGDLGPGCPQILRGQDWLSSLGA